jgi:hypothetical protein
VHGRSGDQLGYAALRRNGDRPPWGGLTLSNELTLDDVRLLAWRADLQLAAAGLERGGHHCLFSARPADPGRHAALTAEFHEALRPLHEQGLCEIVFTDHLSVEPPVAETAFRTCAAVVTLAAMERAGLDPARSTVAVHRPRWAGAEVTRALSARGLTPVSSREALSTPADVLLLDGRPWTMGISEAHVVRARLVVALSPVIPDAAAARRLRDRRVCLLPDTVIGAGRFLALDLWRHGVEPDVAVRRAAAAVRERLPSLVEPCRRSDPPAGSGGGSAARL